VIGFALFLLGAAGWFGGFSPTSAEDKELALGDVGGISIDSKKNIYLALHFYGRVQVYDSKGRFIKGWAINASGGNFRIRNNLNDDLEIATARNDMYYIYSLEKGLIKSIHDPKRFDEFGIEHEKSTRDGDGNTYRIRGWLFPRIEKISASGIKNKLITVPLKKWVLMGPFPAWFFGAAGTIISFVNVKKLIEAFDSIRGTG